jgi:hypothetical protein
VAAEPRQRSGWGREAALDFLSTLGLPAVMFGLVLAAHLGSNGRNELAAEERYNREYRLPPFAKTGNAGHFDEGLLTAATSAPAPVGAVTVLASHGDPR